MIRIRNGYRKSANESYLTAEFFLLPPRDEDEDVPINDLTATNLLVLDGTIDNLWGDDTLREAGIGMNTKILQIVNPYFTCKD